MDRPGTSPSLAITAAIPPVFDACATIVLPDSSEEMERHNRAILASLETEPACWRWWLGYLSTSAGHLVFPGATMAALPKVTLYADWNTWWWRPGRGRLRPGGGTGHCRGAICCRT
jgi:hypothetical protein